MYKRNTEGYVLAYLLVAITVIGLVSATLMASTLKVVQAQEESFQRMQSKFIAQGEIEMIIAELPYQGINQSVAGFDSFVSAQTAGTAALNTSINTFTQSISSSVVHVSTINEGNNSFDITATVNPVSISATVSVFPNLEIVSYSDDIDTGAVDENNNPIMETVTRWKYTILGSDYSFSSYKITSTGGGT